MIDKLPAAEERRVIRGIEKAIALTRAGSVPDDALAKVAVEMGFTPEITKRACEAFNKSKTVHMLTSRTSKDRAEAFEHSDPDKVVAAVFKPVRKEASLAFPRGDWSALDVEKAPPAMEKAAAEKRAAAPFDAGNATEMEYRRNLKQRMEVLDRFDRQRSRVGQLRQEAQEALMKAAEHMRLMKPRELAKVAHVVVNRFGDKGATMLKVIAAKLQRDLPIEKTANGAILPYAPPYPDIDQAIRKASEHAEEKDKLGRLAADAKSFFSGNRQP